MIDVPVEVKKALKKGRCKKEYRIEVLKKNEDESYEYSFTIGNDNLVKESVLIDERMCSDKYLKFGLCEGTSLEFQYFGLEPVSNCKLSVYLRVYYTDNQYYTIPIGYFDVDQCSVQFSTGIRKVVAYNKLMSKYLDSNVAVDVKEIVQNGSVGNPNELPVTMVLEELLDGYSIETNYKSEEITPGENFGGGVRGRDAVWKKTGPTTSQAKYIAQYATTLEYNIPNIDESKVYRVQAFLKKIAEYFYNRYVEFYTGNYYYDRDCTIDYFQWTVRSEELPDPNNSIVLVAARMKDSGGTSIRYSISSNVFHDYYEEGKEIFAESMTSLEGYKQTSLSTPYTFSIFAPVLMGEIDSSSSPYPWTEAEEDAAKLAVARDLQELGVFDIAYIDSALGEFRLTNENMSGVEEVTLRDLQSSVFEAQCQYGQINRETDLFSGVELDSTGLYPAEDLYPEDDLYPNGNTGGKAFHPFPAQYQKLWTDTVGAQSFRYLRITYKTLVDGQETEKVLQRTINTHGTQDYNMSDNWLFRNLVWTPEQIGEYADAMVTKMENIRWFPFEMWSTGLPYVETGDAIEITDKEGNTFTSYVLQRQLRGIQNLQDTFINGELDVF